MASQLACFVILFQLLRLESATSPILIFANSRFGSYFSLFFVDFEFLLIAEFMLNTGIFFSLPLVVTRIYLLGIFGESMLNTIYCLYTSSSFVSEPDWLS